MTTPELTDPSVFIDYTGSLKVTFSSVGGKTGLDLIRNSIVVLLDFTENLSYFQQEII